MFSQEVENIATIYMIRFVWSNTNWELFTYWLKTFECRGTFSLDVLEFALQDRFS